MNIGPMTMQSMQRAARAETEGGAAVGAASLPAAYIAERQHGTENTDMIDTCMQQTELSRQGKAGPDHPIAVPQSCTDDDTSL